MYHRVECKSRPHHHANNYCEFTREMEEINATMMAKIEIVSLIYRENENTHLFFKQTDKVHIGTDHFQLNYYFYLPIYTQSFNFQYVGGRFFFLFLISVAEFTF